MWPDWGTRTLTGGRRETDGDLGAGYFVVATVPVDVEYLHGIPVGIRTD